MQHFTDLIANAHNAGMAALADCVPTPMQVVSADIFGNVTDNAHSYYVADGVCGFAWVHLTKGNTSFAKWAKKNGIASSNYYKGMDIYATAGGQSLAKNTAYATAYAKVLQDFGIDCYVDSRMD